MSIDDLRRWGHQPGPCKYPGCGGWAKRRSDGCNTCRSLWERYGHTEPGKRMPWFPHMYTEYAWAISDYRADRASWLLAAARVAQAWSTWVDRGQRHRTRVAANFLHRRYPWTLAGSGKGSALWVARMVATPHLYRLSGRRDEGLFPMTDRTVALSFNSCLVEAWTQANRQRMSDRRRAWKALKNQAGLGAALAAAIPEQLELVGQRFLAWERMDGVPSEAVQRRQSELLEWLETAPERCIEANRKLAARKAAGLPIHLPGRRKG